MWFATGSSLYLSVAMKPDTLQRPTGWRPVLDPGIPFSGYRPIDLSVSNRDLDGIRLEDPTVCQKYIDRVLKSKQGLVAYGGYLEKRGLYTAHLKFARKGEPGRNIHLGVDFWAAAGTPVVAPMAGRIHSFRDNKGMGDYGPTLILSHESPDGSFYSLYGHLSRDSLMGMERRQEIEEGDVLGFLGPPSVNGGYAPHLHFQLIFDLGTSEGDYPGVCSPEDLSFYTKNCPDPWSLLNKV